jgi:D-arabinose 1-dehydrogenase-like Zn-dependent alcohol dehydrogenase
VKSFDIVEWGRPLQAVVRETPVPEGSQVLLRVEACGVCHSDLHLRDGSLDMGPNRKVTFESLGLRLPFTLGHEIVGTVVAKGPEASIGVGERRVVYPWIGCGRCRHCRRGDELSCEANVALGTRRAGGYADHVLVPHDRYLLDFGDLDPSFAATLACSGLTAFSALRKLPAFTSEDTLLLIGAGGLGLAALGLAAETTQARVIVADIDPAKLELARERGAADVLDLSAAAADARVRAMAGEGVRAVVDFVGAATTVDFALRALGKGGTLVVVGLFGGAVSLPTALLPSRHLTIRGSYVGTLAEMQELLALAERGKVASPPMFRRPLSEINEALLDLGAGRVQGRVVVVPDAPAR